MTVEILAPAKINLFLETGSAAGGFHPIVSLIDIIDLCDFISIDESEKTSVTFSPGWGIPSQNTVVQSVALLKKELGIKKNFKIKVHKNIPPGSGLGGGSSDAAAVLKSVSRYCGISLPEDFLIRMGDAIGKDVPLFIGRERCVAEGFGETVRKVGYDKSLAYLLFVPEFKVSTKEVYSNLDIMDSKGNLTEGMGKIKIILAAIEKHDIPAIEKHIENRLAGSYFNLYPEAGEVKRYIEKATAKSFFVSGSGGTLFAVFAARKEAEEKAVNVKVEGWKSFVAESLKLL